MKECIDIYSRLLIATITFVVPIIINLLSTFSDGEKRRKELAQKLSEELSNSAADEIQSNPQKTREAIERTSRQYKDLERTTTKEVNLLNPLRQFWIVFTNLSISLISLIIFYISNDSKYSEPFTSLSITSLIFSMLFYGIGLSFIIRVLYTIARTKKIT